MFISTISKLYKLLTLKNEESFCMSIANLENEIKHLKKELIEHRKKLLTFDTLLNDIHCEIVVGKRYCPICNNNVRVFLPYGVNPRPNALCPICGSLERHRLVYLYFKEQTNLFTKKIKMLHIAPEKILTAIFSKQFNIDYLSADIDSSRAMVEMDLQDIRLPDNLFDVIYCSHVLEHIPDDRKAMKELYRVLRPGGWAVLQVPIKKNLQNTLENSSVITPEQRILHYGQHDHLRLYGMDYEERLREAGFNVKVDKYIETLDEQIINKYALAKDEYIYFCAK